MKHIPLATRVLDLLHGMAHATSKDLFAHFQPSNPAGLRDCISRLRRQGLIETVSERHSITNEGRKHVAKTRELSLESRQTFGAYSQAKPADMPEVRSVMTRPTWTPPRWEPVRPGADAHKACASRGIA